MVVLGESVASVAGETTSAVVVAPPAPTVVVVVSPPPNCVVGGITRVVVVVVAAVEHASGKEVVRLTDSWPKVYVMVTGPVPADAGYGMVTVAPDWKVSGTEPPVENDRVPV